MASTVTAAQPKRPLFVTVLATVAVLVGVVVAVVTAQTIVRVVRMSAWPTVPATLESVELHLAPGPTTRRAQSVAARYHYVVDGQTHEGTQVSVYAADSLGSFFQRTYNELHGHLERHETVPVHVNPASPSDAVLLPVWRPEVLLFEAVLMLVFGGGGWGLLAGRIGPWRLSQEPDEEDAESASTDDPDSGLDAAPVDMNERLPPAAAWARRWLLIGIVLFAADFVLIDYSRGDSYLFIDRLLATQFVGTGTIGASDAPPGAVEGAFERARRAVSGEARLALDRQQPQGSIYTLSVTAGSRNEVLAELDTLLAGIGTEYRAQSGRALDTFRDPYVAPLRTPELFRRRMFIVGGLMMAGLACVAAWWWLSRSERRE